jgi:hypothetical protein
MQREAGQQPVLAGAAAGPAHTLLQTALDTYRREHPILPAGLRGGFTTVGACRAQISVQARCRNAVRRSAWRS